MLYEEIYGRHPGPYALSVITLEKGKQVTSWQSGPFSAEEADAKAHEMLAAGTGVQHVSVFSNKEKLFIGAFYSSSTRAARAAVAPVQIVDEVPIIQALVANVEEALKDAAANGITGVDLEAIPPPAVVVPVKPPRKTRVAGKPGALLRAASPEKWPAGKAAQILLDYFTSKPASPAQALADVGDAVMAAGVRVPGSMISRLKQSGLLQVVEA